MHFSKEFYDSCLMTRNSWKHAWVIIYKSLTSLHCSIKTDFHTFPRNGWMYNIFYRIASDEINSLQWGLCIFKVTILVVSHITMCCIKRHLRAFYWSVIRENYERVLFCSNECMTIIHLSVEVDILSLFTSVRR